MASSSPIRATALVLALVALGAGCGHSSRHASSQPAVTRAGTAPSAQGKTTPQHSGQRGAPPKSAGIAIHLPRHWAVSRKAISPRTWPRPLAVAASFPVHHLGANAACSKQVLSSIPPHGVFILVSEYTKPRPPGYPPLTPFGTRGDLTHLDIRPSEVECWEGLGGSAHFMDHGRAFFVEVLLGKRVTPAERRRALASLASFRVTRK